MKSLVFIIVNPKGENLTKLIQKCMSINTEWAKLCLFSFASKALIIIFEKGTFKLKNYFINIKF